MIMPQVLFGTHNPGESTPPTLSASSSKPSPIPALSSAPPHPPRPPHPNPIYSYQIPHQPSAVTPLLLYSPLHSPSSCRPNQETIEKPPRNRQNNFISLPSPLLACLGASFSLAWLVLVFVGRVALRRWYLCRSQVSDSAAAGIHDLVLRASA